MFTILSRAIDGLLAQSFTATPNRRISDAFPNILVTDQFGSKFRFRRDFVEKGGALIINTMYTTCRGTCPGTSARIESLRKELSPAFGNRLTFLSFTLEPTIDSPSQLLKYCQDYGAGERKSKLCDWHFLNANPKDWEQLRRSLGFFELDPRVDRDITQHASTLLVGNLKRDRWSRFPAELREPVLLDSIRRIAGNSIEEQFGLRN